MYRIIFIAMTLLLLTGCAAKRDMARLVYQPDAEGSFFDSRGSDSFNYYLYDGPGSRTVAYLALDKRYNQQAQFWTKTAMNKALWQEAYGDLSHFHSDRYQAKAIIASSGETIGYLLTRYYFATAWFVEGSKTDVIIPPPELAPQQGRPFWMWNGGYDEY